MYLVHVALRPPADGIEPPSGSAEPIAMLAAPRERIEHVVVHRHLPREGVIGVYLVADNLEEAEDCAAKLIRRALAELPEWHGWSMQRVGVPLIVPPWA